MPKKVEVISRSIDYEKAIFKVELVKLRHEKYNGRMSEPLTRLNLDRGDAVAAVIHRVDTNEIVLIEQFRYPAYSKGTGWPLELPAGMVRPEEEPANAMRRELVEEVGYEVKKLNYISTFFLSPGGSSERIHLFYAAVRHTDRTHEGGGLFDENEDIRMVEYPVDKIGAMLNAYEIVDAKTIIGLQWFLMNRKSLENL
jgi:nudix-type nucleoside diphosphatase (YffH/AdpP family)